VTSRGESTGLERTNEQVKEAIRTKSIGHRSCWGHVVACIRCLGSRVCFGFHLDRLGDMRGSLQCALLASGRPRLPKVLAMSRLPWDRHGVLVLSYWGLMQRLARGAVLQLQPSQLLLRQLLPYVRKYD
jgi:hypothetical protein